MESHFFYREGVSNDVLAHGLLPFLIISFDSYFVMYAKSGMSPLQIAPVIDELAEDYVDKVSVGKLNVDENPKTATKFGVRGIPTLLFFKEGRVIHQLVGVKPKAEIKKIIDSNL